jgi:RNAse (barnase) inhibitor barstar
MAAFSDDPETFDRVDWRLLQNGPVTLYWRPEYLREDVEWLETHGYIIHRFDVMDWDDLEKMHGEFQSKLAFPNYYGKNLDALNDCLSDVEIPDDAGAALTFAHFDSLVAVHPTVAAALLDILADNSRRAMLFGKRLIALVQTDSPDFRTGPIGATTGIGTVANG